MGPRHHRPRPVSRVPYGNCLVLPPDSEFPMFRCDDERMAWYVDRGLAVRVSLAPPVIRLTFQPKGPGHRGDAYFLQEFENRCVACGSEKNLSHHHIVPDAYRRHFPRDSRNFGRWMYDVLLLCLDCHIGYEQAAERLKEEIASEYGVSPAGRISLSIEELRVMKAAAALYRHGDKIPSEKKVRLLQDVCDHLGKNYISREELRLVWKGIRRSMKSTSAGEIVVLKIKDLDGFAIRWRRHFMETLKPRFLPEGWNPERRIYSEPDQVEIRG